MTQRPISLNPEARRSEVVKITYPATHSRVKHWKIEAMRFIPHDGNAKG